MAEQFDLIVIGGGPGGYVAAIRGAQHGLRVALVEGRELGGTCLNRGCIPTKALLHAATLYREVAEASDLGIFTDGLRYDLTRMYQRKDAVVDNLREGVAGLLRANGVTCYTGHARLLGDGLVNVSQQMQLTAPRILLAVGAGPQKPSIPGMELEGVLSSDDILGETPMDCGSLVILGGGVIGTEMASLYRALGCEVSILEAAERILPTADREISQNLAMIFKKRGITLSTSSMLEEITKTDTGLCLRYTDKKGEQFLHCERLLVSVGRKPRLDDLCEPGLVLETAHGGILVNRNFETSLPGVYAIGDCIAGGVQLAHVASAQATNVLARMLGKSEEMNLNVIPGCIYTNPEIAWVGLSADEAKKQGRSVKISKYVMSGNGKSMIERQERGFVKLVFDEDSEVLLGAQLMCGRATDLIAGLTSAIANGLCASELSTVIHPHPSFGEGLGEAVEDLFSRAVHSAPKRKK